MKHLPDDISKMTRNDVVPFYIELIKSRNGKPLPDKVVIRMNKKILSKWTSSGLTYIKEKAWKQVQSP